MKQLDLLKQNEAFVERHQPDYFETLSQGQEPGCLVLACSDSRVSPSVVTQAPLGSIFVHRNIANQVVAGDPGFDAGLYYALAKLKVKKIVIKGHTGCGGIAAAAAGEAAPELDGWMRHIRMAIGEHACHSTPEEMARANVLEQVRRLQAHPIYQKHGQGVPVEGYLFHLETGRLELLPETAAAAP